MEVSHIHELDTHAVIGGGTAEAFSSADTAEFYTILSDTLYSDKPMAVAREVLCNADDAHIKTGRKAIPVEIQLTDTSFIVKDFGPGIPHDKMVKIYCTYGGSTKADDPEQTGGFGLGTKVPFAVTDHFTVTNCHAGQKVVYAISRGGPETNGKPSILPMVGPLPTTESGITVSVPLKNKSDKVVFQRKIIQVIYQGGINATLNGTQMQTLDFSEADKQGYCLINSSVLTESSVYVRYGAVLYPVSQTNDAYRGKFSHFPAANNNLKLVLIGKPGSMSPTPSRETLSNGDRTVKAVLELMNKAIRQLHAARNAGVKLIATRAVEKLEHPAAKHSFNSMLNGTEVEFSGVLVNPVEIAAQYIWQQIYNYGNSPFYVSDSIQQIAIFRAMLVKFREHRRFFRRCLNQGGRDQLSRRNLVSGAKWIPDNTRVLIRALHRVDALKYLFRMAKPLDVHDRRRHWKPRLMPFAQRSHVFSQAPTVVLARTKAQAEGWFAGALMSTVFKDQNAYAVVVCSTLKAEHIQCIQLMLQKYNIPVIELDLAKPAAAPREKKPKLPKAKEMFFDAYALYDVRCPKFKDSYTPNIEQPAFYVAAEDESNRSRVYGNVMKQLIEHRELFKKLYPNVAIAVWQSHRKKFPEMGIPELFPKLKEELLTLSVDDKGVQFACIGSTGEFLEHYSYNGVSGFAVDLAQADTRFAKILFPEAAKTAKTSERNCHLIDLANNVAFSFIFSQNDWKEVEQHIKKIKDSAKKTFGVSRFKDRNAAEKHFSYLKPLNDIRARHLDITYSDELAEIIRMLKTRADKKSAPVLTVVPSTITTPKPAEEAVAA